MNKEETRQILSVLRLNYPQSYRDYNEATSAMLLDLWAEVFKNTPLPLVQEAVVDIIAHDYREFAPNPGQIHHRILSKYGKNHQAEALEAWDQIKDYMSGMNWDYSDKDRYDRLPEGIRKYYSYSDLKTMAQNRSSDNDAYEKPRFLKNYSELAAARDEKLISTQGITAVLDHEKLKEIGHE